MGSFVSLGQRGEISSQQKDWQWAKLPAWYGIDRRQNMQLAIVTSILRRPQCSPVEWPLTYSETTLQWQVTRETNVLMSWIESSLELSELHSEGRHGTCGWHLPRVYDALTPSRTADTMRLPPQLCTDRHDADRDTRLSPTSCISSTRLL